MIRVAWAGAALWAIMWTAPSPAAQGLPPETLLALQRAKVPAEAMSVVVHDASTGQRVLQWQATRPVNPASLTKLLTTMAALERLGPAWHWQTPVWISGPLKDGVLEGSVFIRGSGDPKLVLERLWLLPVSYTHLDVYKRQNNA